MLCVVTVSVLFLTVFQVMTSYGTAYKSQDASNHDFCQTFVDFKEPFVGGRLECQNSMF